MECSICKTNFNLGKKRSNGYVHGHCQNCGWQSAYWIGRDLKLSLSFITKRFSHNGTTWHATYRPDQNQTIYKKVTYKIHPEDIRPNISYPLPSLVLTDRFITLLPFL